MSKKCPKCNKNVYPADPQLKIDGLIFHMACARCEEPGCNAQLNLQNYTMDKKADGTVNLMCKTHYKMHFQKSGGVYKHGADRFRKSTTGELRSSTTEASQHVMSPFSDVDADADVSKVNIASSLISLDSSIIHEATKDFKTPRGYYHLLVNAGFSEDKATELVALSNESDELKDPTNFDPQYVYMLEETVTKLEAQKMVPEVVYEQEEVIVQPVMMMMMRDASSYITVSKVEVKPTLVEQEVKLTEERPLERMLHESSYEQKLVEEEAQPISRMLNLSSYESLEKEFKEKVPPAPLMVHRSSYESLEKELVRMPLEK